MLKKLITKQLFSRTSASPLNRTNTILGGGRVKGSGMCPTIRYIPIEVPQKILAYAYSRGNARIIFTGTSRKRDQIHSSEK